MQNSLWRNRLAHSAVNRKVGGSSPPRDVGFLYFINFFFSMSNPVNAITVELVAALLADLHISLGLSHLCCFRKNMAELSPDLRQLPCE
ncbi:hypothetical protein T4D_3943 [Trichinella pseudospiralis]|uniref:Uncharacterized protein n=1 Tax=Trichinella pseudospiralis TaxID=6337 RepID=A0A0V1FRU2_TRIPS|nr:hypothetical protein T4D_3943 [Trichinella pseudospiralis]